LRTRLRDERGSVKRPKTGKIEKGEEGKQKKVEAILTHILI
jgi:hypothetical protein